MVRPCKCRVVRFSPEVTYFKPRGVPLRALETIELSLDELEAIRLKYSSGLEQTEAAKKMKISQSTFHRLLNRANKKIATALINGKAIKFNCGCAYIVRRGGQSRQRGSAR